MINLVSIMRINDEKLKTYRVLDANINRAREGIRVVEEIVRLLWDNKGLTRAFKTLRSQLLRAVKALPDRHLLLVARQARADVGRTITGQTEEVRDDLESIFSANMKRAQEACRVLEEFSKRLEKQSSKKFKQLRFKLYEMEKKINFKLFPE